MQSHAGNGRRYSTARSYWTAAIITIATVRCDGFCTVWPWPLTFCCFLAPCMTSDCYKVNMYKFGINSSCRFPVRAQTNRQTNRRDWTPYPRRRRGQLENICSRIDMQTRSSRDARTLLRRGHLGIGQLDLVKERTCDMTDVLSS